MPTSGAIRRTGEDSCEFDKFFFLNDECVDVIMGEDCILNSESVVPNFRGDDLPLGEKLPGIKSGSCISLDEQLKEGFVIDRGEGELTSFLSVKGKSVRILGVNLGKPDRCFDGENNGDSLLYTDEGEVGNTGRGEFLDERLEAVDNILDLSSGDRLEFDNCPGEFCRDDDRINSVSIRDILFMYSDCFEGLPVRDEEVCLGTSVSIFL